MEAIAGRVVERRSGQRLATQIGRRESADQSVGVAWMTEAGARVGMGKLPSLFWPRWPLKAGKSLRFKHLSPARGVLT